MGNKKKQLIEGRKEII